MSRLVEIITGEVQKQGIISFDRFMELALYCPVYGYYEAETDKIGRRGDFFTSVSVGSLFGELLAFHFSQCLAGIGNETSHIIIAEAGAHDGQLAEDVLNAMRARHAESFERLEYWIIEPSRQRTQIQKTKLAGFAEKVHWAPRISDVDGGAGNDGIRGVVFSNELLDAMPVHRVGWDAAGRTWFEWGVAREMDQFVWRKMPLTAAVRDRVAMVLPPGLLEVLPDNYTIEIGLAAQDWWHEAANALKCGELLTVDYGLSAEELFSPARPQGTLRAYFQHHAVEDVLANVGKQDLTAHVNFAGIQTVGETRGLKTEAFLTQSTFLTRIAEQIAKDHFSLDWTPQRARQFQTLTHPEHLGRAFRVLVQSRKSGGACSS